MDNSTAEQRHAALVEAAQVLSTWNETLALCKRYNVNPKATRWYPVYLVEKEKYDKAFHRYTNPFRVDKYVRAPRS